MVSKWDAFNHSELFKAYLVYVLIPNKGVISGNGKPQQTYIYNVAGGPYRPTAHRAATAVARMRSDEVEDGLVRGH